MVAVSPLAVTCPRITLPPAAWMLTLPVEVSVPVLISPAEASNVAPFVALIVVAVRVPSEACKLAD